MLVMLDDDVLFACFDWLFSLFDWLMDDWLVAMDTFHGKGSALFQEISHVIVIILVYNKEYLS